MRYMQSHCIFSSKIYKGYKIYVGVKMSFGKMNDGWIEYLIYFPKLHKTTLF